VLSLALTLGASESSSAAVVRPRPSPPPPPGLFWGFDAGFSTHMVLQRAPAAAAIYGYLDSPGATGVKVTVSSGGVPLYTVDAVFNATTQPFGNGWGVRPFEKMRTFTPFNYSLPTWKALLQPTVAGGNYTITAVCTGCSASAAPLIMTDVTFGDVWVCAGQSNAMLWVSHSFTRNESARNYSAGQFNNIRIMGGNDCEFPYTEWPPAYANGNGVKNATNPWMTAAEAVPDGCIEKQTCPLFWTSGACWYALQNVAEAGVDVPLGLVALTLGGQRIEEFMNNETSADGPYVCEHLAAQNIPWWNGQLYGAYMLSFIDTSIKGWLW
jgi:hypothetical protein